MFRTKEIAAKLKISKSLLCHWAKKNNVLSIGVADKKTYLWTENDIALFLTRNKKVGKPKKNL